MSESVVGFVILVIFLLLVALLIVAVLLWIASAAGLLVVGGAFLKSFWDGMLGRTTPDEMDVVERILERHDAELTRHDGAVMSVSVDEERLDALLSDLREHGYEPNLHPKDD